MLVDLSVEDFCKVLGSDAPAPGGGSVAAMSGALAASLVSMVCRLSLGRKDYEEHNNVLTEVLEKSEALSKSLLRRIDLDTEAFNAVMAAFKLPKATDEDKKARTSEIHKSYKNAAQSPLQIAIECRDVLALAGQIVGKSNANALSDLGVASQQALSGLEGAIMNVKINLPSIKDEGFKSNTLSLTAALSEEGRKLQHDISNHVTSKPEPGASR